MLALGSSIQEGPTAKRGGKNHIEGPPQGQHPLALSTRHDLVLLATPRSLLAGISPAVGNRIMSGDLCQTCG